MFPGELDTAVAGWFGRFPAEAQAYEDIYLLDPPLPGLSVKIRSGQAFEVKTYRGSRGILEVTGRARGALRSWQKWSFPLPARHEGRACLAVGHRCSRPGRSATSAWLGGTGPGPRTASLGGPSDWKRPAQTPLGAPSSRLPPCSFSTSPCRTTPGSAQKTPPPIPTGSPRRTPTPAKPGEPFLTVVLSAWIRDGQLADGCWAWPRLVSRLRAGRRSVITTSPAPLFWADRAVSFR